MLELSLIDLIVVPPDVVQVQLYFGEESSLKVLAIKSSKCVSLRDPYSLSNRFL